VDSENLLISDEDIGLISIDLNTSKKDKQLRIGGRGPGEFEFISDIHLGKHSKKLLLLDSELFRVSFYTGDSLLFLDSFILPNVTSTGEEAGLFSPSRIWEVSVDNNINYIVLYGQSFTINTEMDKRKKRLMLFDRSLNIIDEEFLELKADNDVVQIKKGGGFMVAPKLYGVKNLIDFTSDGKAVQLWTEFPCLLIDNQKQCLKVDQIEVTKEDINYIEENSDTDPIMAYYDVTITSLIDKTFPFFDDMQVYKSDDSNPDLIWLSRNKGVQELELIEYSLSSKKIIRTITVSGWLKLVAISDTTAYLIPHPRSNVDPQILEVSLN
jgi:hypothetical protein